MKKIGKNITILICAALLVVLLILAAFFQDSLIHIVTEVWSGLGGEIKVEESSSKKNSENELILEESAIEQKEYMESQPQAEESEANSGNSDDSLTELDSNIQVFPSVEESGESSEAEQDSREGSDENEESDSQVPEESDSQNGNSKLTEFPITPF